MNAYWRAATYLSVGLCKMTIKIRDYAFSAI